MSYRACQTVYGPILAALYPCLVATNEAGKLDSAPTTQDVEFHIVECLPKYLMQKHNPDPELIFSC